MCFSQLVVQSQISHAIVCSPAPANNRQEKISQHSAPYFLALLCFFFQGHPFSSSPKSIWCATTVWQMGVFQKKWIWEVPTCICLWNPSPRKWRNTFSCKIQHPKHHQPMPLSKFHRLMITQFTMAEKTWWAVGQETQNRHLPEWCRSMCAMTRRYLQVILLKPQGRHHPSWKQQ